MTIEELDAELSVDMKKLNDELSRNEYRELLKDLIVDALWRAGMVKTAAVVQEQLETN